MSSPLGIFTMHAIPSHCKTDRRYNVVVPTVSTLFRANQYVSHEQRSYLRRDAHRLGADHSSYEATAHHVTTKPIYFVSKALCGFAVAD
jgi:hypothetical protein